MKLVLVLTTDKGQFISQVEVSFPESDLELSSTEFSFRNCIASKAVEMLQSEGTLNSAIKRYGGVMCPSSLSVN
jgi:hypothetical protein